MCSNLTIVLVCPRDLPTYVAPTLEVYEVVDVSNDPNVPKKNEKELPSIIEMSKQLGFP
jgi:hypothetical protein